MLTNLLGHTLGLGGKIKDYFFSQGRFFVNHPFDSPNKVTVSIDSTHSEQSTEWTVTKRGHTALLGGTTEELSKNIQKLSEDAAALCQYVYAANDILPSFTPTLHPESNDCWYHSRSWADNHADGWYPYDADLEEFMTDPKYDASTIPSPLSHPSRPENTPATFLQEVGYVGLLDGIRGRGNGTAKDLFNILKGRLKRERTGFGSMIFYKKNQQNRVCCVAYVTEGSRNPTSPLRSARYQNKHTTLAALDWMGDWLGANLLQGTTGLSPQHTLSIQNARILDKICSQKGIELYFFGHSLGGGLAVSNAMATGRRAIVFNMAGLHFTRILRYKVEYDALLKGKKILSYWTDQDILSRDLWTVILLKPNGNRYNIGSGGHDLKNICRNIFHLPPVSESPLTAPGDASI